MTLYALKNPVGKIYAWSLGESFSAVKNRVKRWNMTWRQAEAKGFKIVVVEVNEIDVNIKE